VEYWAGREVTGDEKCKAMRACKIALNTNHYAGIGDVNKRTFELAGIGAFQLTDERAALDDYFVPDLEVATFRGPKDLRDKVAYYLARPQERAAIAVRAQQRAHRDHTFERRLTTLLGTLGLPLTG
jgi:spore maturation protein CgeB